MNIIVWLFVWPYVVIARASRETDSSASEHRDRSRSPLRHSYLADNLLLDFGWGDIKASKVLELLYLFGVYFFAGPPATPRLQVA